jgi:hypothetical protein
MKYPPEGLVRPAENRTTGVSPGLILQKPNWFLQNRCLGRAKSFSQKDLDAAHISRCEICGLEARPSGVML